jgi:hypothetical protein
MMPKLVPDKLNGKGILRPVDYSGPTPKLASSAVFHPPSVGVEYPKVPVGRMVEAAAHGIVSMRAMTTSELIVRLNDFATQVLENDKRRLKPNG